MTRYVRFSLDASTPPTTRDPDPAVKYGIVDGGTVFETPGAFSDERTGASFSLTRVRLLPPCSPTKIVCVGRNYPDHAAELGNEPPAEPIIFLKPPSALLAHGDAIQYPAISRLVSYEGELGVVIGSRARHLTPEQAPGAVFGYTCVNDVTARDLQRKDHQWTRAKGFDTFCPVGPWIVPRDELTLGEVRVRTYVDDKKVQDAPITDMLFSVDDIIAFVTEFMTLEPGDLIATGTPPGVGPLAPGAQVQVLVEGVGTLQNHVAGR